MYDYIFKICVFGDYNTGKTSFLNLLQNYNYVKIYEPTIGVEYSTEIMSLSDNKTVKVTFWDCAGQERFHSVTENFFRDVTGGMLFFDVSNHESYRNVFDWINRFRKFNNKNIPLLLVGNKIDKKRVVSKHDAYTFASDFNLKYIETSVKEGINIKNALELLVDDIYLEKDKNPNIQELNEKDDCILIKKKNKNNYCHNCCIS